jgi:hypothetical protein
MKRFIVGIFALFIVLIGSHAHADHHHIRWLEYMTGEWSYTWSAEKGEFAETGTIRWRRVAKKAALIGNVETSAGDREVEIIGWNPSTKTLDVTGFSSNGGCWRLAYTKLGDNEAVAGSASGVLPDGRSWKSDSWTLKRIDDDHLEIHSKGEAGGEPLVTVGRFERKPSEDTKK